MTSSADVITGRVQTYLSYPLVQRCKELSLLIDELSTTELQHIFPILLDSIFGLTDHYGWGLHTITLNRYPQEFEVLCRFLGPQGPIFSLCYKLLPDCYLKYNFPVSYLPSKIRHMLEEGIILAFYYDKIKEDYGSRIPNVLSMNPFEYYIFHFAYHLTNPWLHMQSPENVWIEWETVYVELAHYYLFHFLPGDNSPVLPIIGPYIKKTPPRKLLSSDSKKIQTPKLLRSSITSPSSCQFNSIPQQQCLSQVWRSETIVQVFLDFWLEYTEEEQFSPNRNSQISPSIPRRHSIHTGEHIRLVRTFIKTLHEFANSTVGDKSAMDELKRIILPSVQGKIYCFLRQAVLHWPLDSSFRLILEAWLSFIQPWRYVTEISFSKQGRVEEEERGKIHDPNKWIPFIANNLLAYTVIFQQLLPRFMRTDLVAPKNAHMLFRVTKVFSQPHLARILQEIENCIEDVAFTKSRLTSQWSSTVHQQILDLEGPSYQYIPMFSLSTISQIICFLSNIKQAHLTANSLIEALEKRKMSRRFFSAIWELFNGEDCSSDDISLEDRKKVPIFLANAQQQLIEIFQINIDDIPQSAIVADEEYHESILSSTTFCNQTDMETSLDTTRPGAFLPVQDDRQSCRYIEYMGDPELQPVRSYEIAFLVKILYKLCNYINNKYEAQILETYNRGDFVGKLARQIVKPPTKIIQLPKRTPSGFTSKCEKTLPPHLSLRNIASYYFLSSIMFGMLIFKCIGYGTPVYISVLISTWIFYLLIKAVCEPISRNISAQRFMQLLSLQQ